MLKTKEQKGITLITLVITILILLILTGIAINLTIGKNGIFDRAKRAKEANKKAQIIEYLDIKLLEEQSKHYLETNEKTKEEINETIIKETKNNVERNKQDLEKIGKEVEIREVEKEKEDIYFYVIVDRGVYKVTLEGTKYKGNRIDKEVELQEGEIEFKYTPSGWTNENVKVEIINNKREIKEGKIQYRKEKESEWKEYKGEIEVEENQVIYAKIVGVLESSTVVTGNVTKIDKTKPIVNIEISSRGYTSEALNAKVTLNDNESSINLAKSKWVYNTNSNEEININEYTGSFTSEIETINSIINTEGNYYLHVLAVDNAGNIKQSVSSKVNIVKASALIPKMTSNTSPYGRITGNNLYEGYKSFDNNVGTKSDTNDSGVGGFNRVGQYIQYQFRNSVLIYRVKFYSMGIKSGGGYSNTYGKSAIQLSSNGSSWTTIYQENEFVQRKSEWKVIDIPNPISANYIRFICTAQKEKSWGWVLFEAQAYGK